MTDTTTNPKRQRRMAREPQTAMADTSEQVERSPAKPKTKARLVEDLLVQTSGASLDELCQATGWQAHTVRAFFTGLRKKGLLIKRHKADGETRYAIVAVSAP